MDLQIPQIRCPFSRVEQGLCTSIAITQAEPWLTLLLGLGMAGACIWKEEQAVCKCRRKKKSLKLDRFLLGVVVCLAVTASLLGSIRCSPIFSPWAQLANAFATYARTKK